MATHPGLGLLVKLSHDVHSIASAYPEVAVELADPSLSSARYDSDETVDWLCPHCDRKWRCPISDRTIRRVKHGCIDADETLTDEADSLAAKVPELVDRWDTAANHAAASDVPATSKRTWSWRCPQHGETWSMSIRDARRAQPCGQCRREKIGRSSRERWTSRELNKTILDDPTLLGHWLTDENEVRPDAVSATDKTYRRWFSCSDCSAPTHKTPKSYSLSPRCGECAKKHRDKAARLRKTIAAMLRGDAEAILRDHVDDGASTTLADAGAGSGLAEATVGNGSPEWWACKQSGWQLQRVDGPRAWALKTIVGAGPMLRSHVCVQREVAAGDPAYLAWDAGTSTWRRSSPSAD